MDREDKMKASAIALPWVEEIHYPLMKSLMTDGDHLPASFALWEASARRLEAALTATGKQVVRVYIDPATFMLWCGERGAELNAAARMAFAKTAIGRKSPRDVRRT